MKRTVLLLCMSCFATSQLAAQEVIDTMYLFCQYKSNCIKLTAQKRVKNLIRLEIGKKLSVSYSYYTCQWDSFYCQPDHSNKLPESFQQARDRGNKNPFEAFPKYPSPKTLTIVYKNYPKGKKTIRLNFLRGYRRFLNNMGSLLDAGSDMKLGITSGAGNLMT